MQCAPIQITFSSPCEIRLNQLRFGGCGNGGGVIALLAVLFCGSNSD